jgi:hypothetical protein
MRAVSVMKRFTDQGVMSVDDARMPLLHMTVANTKYRKNSRVPIPVNAREILERYANHEWGLVRLDRLAMCALGGVDKDGGYVITAAISLP